MNEENQKSVDVKNFITIFPVWDNSVWLPLQKKQYDVARQNLKIVISGFNNEEKKRTFWLGLLKGVPAARGTLTETEWQTEIRPLLIKTALDVLNGRELSNVYQGLDLPEQLELILFSLKNAYGDTSEERLVWLKSTKPSLYTLLIASPAQELGINPKIDYHLFLLQKSISRYDSLTQILRNQFFSYENSETLYRIGRNNHLTDEKISLLARLVGRVLLGFLHIEDFKKEIVSTLFIDPRTADILFQEIQEKIFLYLRNEIKTAYEPLDETTTKIRIGAEKAISLEDISDSGEKPIPVEITSESVQTETEPTPSSAPLILHTEEFLTEEERPVNRGFLGMLGFFKSRRQNETKTPEIRAQIETFGDKKKEKTEKRVVHYSEFRTQLTPFDQDNKFIKTKSEEIAESRKIELETDSKENETKTQNQAVSVHVTTKLEEINPPLQSVAPKSRPTVFSDSKKSFWFAKNIAKKLSSNQAPTQPKQPHPSNSETKTETSPKIKGNTIDLSSNA